MESVVALARRGRVFCAGKVSLLALGIALSVPVQAQTAGTPPVAPQGPAAEENATPDIVVTGIRASLATAADLKRASGAIMDSIAAEDIGKFPDSNVAESLQRIPGVSINRSDGEGQFVTVRGFGPAFNTVLVNGRALASDNVGREFSFDLLAAELINGADVYKSSQANMPDGGIGSTINLKTQRPLDFKGLKVVTSAKANYEVKSENVSPQLFGLISKASDDGRFGILAAVSYQKRRNINDYVETPGYVVTSEKAIGFGPSETLDIFAPRSFDVIRQTQNRERLGINLTAQYRPSDELTLTVDGLYNRFKNDSVNDSLGDWFEPSGYVPGSVKLDKNRTVTALTTNWTEAFVNSSTIRDVTTKAIGANVEWKPSDLITVKVDSSFSNAKNAGGGKSYFIALAVPTTYSFLNDGTNDFPTLTTRADLLSKSGVLTHVAQRTGSDVSENVFDHKLDAAFDTTGGVLKTVRLGANWTRRKKTRVDRGTLNVNCTYCGSSVVVDPSLLREKDLGSFIDATGTVPTKFLTYDPKALIGFLESDAATNELDRTQGRPVGTTAALMAANGGYNAQVSSGSSSVVENVYSAYLDTDFEGELGGLPWFVNVGARYMHTTLSSTGNQLALLDLLPIVNETSSYNAVFANNGLAESITKTASYDYLLPSLNLKVTFDPTIIGRFSMSKTVTRPQIDDLAPRTGFDVIRPAQFSAIGGNPNLKPYQSTNLDLSVEWYPNRTTMLSAAGFYKKVNDFIYKTKNNEPIKIANAGKLPVGGVITGPNEATASVLRPTNAGEVAVHGYEFNLVHTLDWLPGFASGLGVQLNATFVKSDREFDITGFAQNFALAGLGNSQNATVFYEKYGLSARVAYNRREKFLLALVNPAAGSDPIFTRTYGQVDARVSFDITSNIQIFVEGTNITNAQSINTGRFDNQILRYLETGARYALGVRANF